MSRTRKDRPYWVLKNDPKMSRRAIHEHLIPQREKVGEEEYNLYAWRPDIEPVVRIRPLFKRWTEQVECTLDIPEKNHTVHTGSWQGARTNEEMLEGKHCEYLLDYYPNIRSNKDNKRLINKSVRAKSRSQCRQLAKKFDNVYDWREELMWLKEFTLEDVWYAQGIDPDDWDVYADPKRTGRNWWWD